MAAVTRPSHRYLHAIHHPCPASVSPSQHLLSNDTSTNCAELDNTAHTLNTNSADNNINNSS